MSSNFKVYSIDLPGFGESQVGVPLGVEDVAEILHDFVIELGLDAPVLCGHSYGGRVAIIYASKFSVEKLVLISSAGLKQKLKFSKRFKVRIYKILKKCHIPVKMGSTDYQNADNVKRIMLVKAVNTDLKNELKLIAAPTLLLYGTKDTVTPLSLGYQMKQYIHNAELVELEECGHFPYLERPSIFAIILMSFLVGESDDY